MISFIAGLLRLSYGAGATSPHCIALHHAAVLGVAASHTTSILGGAALQHIPLLGGKPNHRVALLARHGIASLGSKPHRYISPRPASRRRADPDRSTSRAALRGIPTRFSRDVSIHSDASRSTSRAARHTTPIHPISLLGVAAHQADSLQLSLAQHCATLRTDSRLRTEPLHNVSLLGSSSRQFTALLAGPIQYASLRSTPNLGGSASHLATILGDDPKQIDSRRRTNPRRISSRAPLHLLALLGAGTFRFTTRASFQATASLGGTARIASLLVSVGGCRPCPEYARG